jgi:hypothetical protein
VVHHASPTRGAVVVRTMMDGHRPDCKFRGNPPPDSEIIPPPNSEN